MKLPNQNKGSPIFLFGLCIPAAWLALIAGACAGEGKTIGAFLADFTAAVNAPFSIRLTPYSGRALLIAFVLYGFGIALYYSMKGNRRPGEEHGSAVWGRPDQLCAKYRDRKKPFHNLIFTQNVKMGMNAYKHRRNLNVLVVGCNCQVKIRQKWQTKIPHFLLKTGKSLKDLHSVRQAPAFAVEI
jgi:type IV secretion system protein VirD4